MNMKKDLLEKCTQDSKRYAKLMVRYRDFFNCLLTNPLQAFGYERWMSDNSYIGVSNMPAIAELFVETEAFSDQNVIAQPKNTSSFCTFIYPNTEVYNSNYNKFRDHLESHLEIRTTFCIVKREMNYCEAFVWNFKKPQSNLLDEKATITKDFIKNGTLISACIDQFKKEIAPLISANAFSVIDINHESPLYKHNENPAHHIGDYSQYIEFSYYSQILQNQHLSLSDFGLSEQEQKMIEVFLKNPDPRNNSYEDLRRISLKLESLKNIGDFEKDYHKLQVIGLAR